MVLIVGDKCTFCQVWEITLARQVNRASVSPAPMDFVGVTGMLKGYILILGKICGIECKEVLPFEKAYVRE
jgi:hypothetical protein